MKEIREDVRLRMIGTYRDAIEEVVKRLHLPPCLNKRVDLSAMELQTLWTHSGMSSRHSSPAVNPFTTPAVEQLKMYQVEDPTFGMRNIHFPTHRCWGL
jgi:hypothetical protein